MEKIFKQNRFKQKQKPTPEKDLSLAVERKNIEAFKLLLQNNKIDTTVLNDSEHCKIINYMRVHWNYLDQELCKTYIVETITKNTNVNSKLLKDILLYALIDSQEEFVKILLDNEIDINVNNSEILSTLVESTDNRAIEPFASAIKLAIKYGANVTNEINDIAQKNGISEALFLNFIQDCNKYPLQDAGADLDTQTKDGKTTDCESVDEGMGNMSNWITKYLLNEDIDNTLTQLMECTILEIGATKALCELIEI